MARPLENNGRQVGRYLVNRRLGSGANSVIYEVADPATGGVFALKRVVRRHFDDERFIQQVQTEFDTGRLVDHPAIRKVFDLVRIRSMFRLKEVHLLMEMFYGQSLEANRPSDPLGIVRVFLQVAAGLGAMHEQGYVHADIKPNNILVGPDGRVKIIDLGQSCPLGAVKDRIQGTPDYIAPEQVYRRPIDRRTDVFNVGASMYWVLTGQHVPTVIPKTQPGREIALVNPAVLQSPEQVNPAVPPALSRLVMDCVNTQPADRPADMKTLCSRLEVIELIVARERARTDVVPQPSTSAADDLDDTHEFDPDEFLK